MFHLAYQPFNRLGITNDTKKKKITNHLYFQEGKVSVSINDNDKLVKLEKNI